MGDGRKSKLRGENEKREGGGIEKVGIRVGVERSRDVVKRRVRGDGRKG